MTIMRVASDNCWRSVVSVILGMLHPLLIEHWICVYRIERAHARRERSPARRSHSLLEERFGSLKNSRRGGIEPGNFPLQLRARHRRNRETYLLRTSQENRVDNHRIESVAKLIDRFLGDLVRDQER